MKASVVMPVYNGGERMRRTIESVLNQTERDFEFICIDDGSTDGVSGSILNEYASKDPRMVVVHRENRGVCDTLNECHQMARAEFIARTDQDDVMHPRLLEYCLRAVAENGLDFLAFRYAKIVPGRALEFGGVHANPQSLKVWDSERRKEDPTGYCSSLCKVHTDTWAHFVRKALVVAHPVLPEWGMTRPFLQIRDARRWGQTDEVLYYYDPGVQTSMSHQTFTMQDFLWDMEDARNLLDAFEPVRMQGDPYGEWGALVQAFVIKRLKITFNAIRRSKGRIAEEKRRALFAALADVIREFFFERRIPFRYARLRHRIAYLFLILRYRKRGGNREHT